MAGPQVRGDIKVSRNVQTRKVRQGTRNFAAVSGTATLNLTSGDPYSVVIGVSTDSTGAVIRLPAVVAGSAEGPASASDPQIHTPIGPQSGIGTEFRITNLSSGSVPINDSVGSPQLTGGLPSGNTAIAFCTDASTAVGVWHVYVVDASSTNLTPNNITFDAGVGTKATGTVTLAGASTATGTITVSFTNVAGTTYSVVSNISSGTSSTAAAIIVANDLNSDANFQEFYTATANASVITITSLDNGALFNATAVNAVSTATDLTSVGTALASGTAGSWTHDIPNNIYTFTVAEVRHRRGIDPIYEVFEHEVADLDRVKVLIESQVTILTGTIVITVNDTPSGRFAGSVDVL